MKIKILNAGGYSTNGRITFPVVVEDDRAKVFPKSNVVNISSDVLKSVGFTDLDKENAWAFCVKGHKFGVEAVIL